MDVTYFRRRREGPETKLEDAIVQRLGGLFPESGLPQWVGGGVPIGAGLPDLVSVWCEPHVVSLADFATTDGKILAYLRAVREARVETIADRVRGSRRGVQKKLEQFLEVEAVLLKHVDVFSLSPAWREVLPQIITIEAKISDWKRAVQQAARNRLFAHKSFVALPADVARRVRGSGMFGKLGVGVIAVGEAGDVRIVKRAPRHNTSVWSYYFQLASIAAKHVSSKYALHR